MLDKKIVYLFPMVLYIGIGLFNDFDDLAMLIGLAIFFTLSLYFLSFSYSFFRGIRTQGIIDEARYGYTEMKEGNSNRYYVKYNINGQEHVSRILYATSTILQPGDSVQIVINKNNMVIFQKDLKYFIFFSFFVLTLSIVFLFFKTF